MPLWYHPRLTCFATLLLLSSACVSQSSKNVLTNRPFLSWAVGRIGILPRHRRETLIRARLRDRSTCSYFFCWLFQSAFAFKFHSNLMGLAPNLRPTNAKTKDLAMLGTYSRSQELESAN